MIEKTLYQKRVMVYTSAFERRTLGDEALDGLGNSIDGKSLKDAHRYGWEYDMSSCIRRLTLASMIFNAFEGSHGNLRVTREALVSLSPDLNRSVCD